MRDYTQEQLEYGRPEKSAYETVTFCLRKLYEDQDCSIRDEVVDGLIFEEVIGALLLAKDSIEELQELSEGEA